MDLVIPFPVNTHPTNPIFEKGKTGQGKRKANFFKSWTKFFASDRSGSCHLIALVNCMKKLDVEKKLDAEESIY